MLTKLSSLVCGLVVFALILVSAPGVAPKANHQASGALLSDLEPADYIDAVALATSTLDRERVAQIVDHIRDRRTDGDTVFVVSADSQDTAAAFAYALLYKSDVRAVTLNRGDLAERVSALLDPRTSDAFVILAPNGVTPEIQAVIDVVPGVTLLLTNDEPFSLPRSGSIVLNVDSHDAAVVSAVHAVVCDALVVAIPPAE